VQSGSRLIKRWLIIAFIALSLTVVLLGLDATVPVHAQTSASAELRLLQSDANRIVLELQVSGYTTQPRTIGRANYVELSIPGLGFIGEPGKPQLPVKGTMIGIPAGAQPALKIVADEAQRVKLDAPPLPVPTERFERNPRSVLPDDAGETFIPDAATYSANRLYPADAVLIGTDSKWRSQHYLTIQFYPLQYNGATRELTFHRRLRVEITFAYPRGQTREAVGSAVTEGSFEPTLQNMLLNYDSAKAWRAQTTLPRVSAKPAYSGGPWYRIGVNADGMYKVTCAQLHAQGASPTLDPNTLKVYKQNNELRIYQVWQSGDPCDDNHYIVFWGQGLDTKYTDTNMYWLTYGGTTSDKRMTTRDGSGSGSVPDPYTLTAHLEDNLYYYSNVPGSVEGIERWYWGYFYPGSPWTTNFQVTDLVTTMPYSATLGFSLAGLTTGAHRIQIFVNGYPTPITEIVRSGQGPFTGTVPFPMTYLANGTNSISVAELASDIIPPISVVNSFDVAYTRAFVALTDTLRFRQPTSGAWQYAITNFTAAAIQAFDISDPLNVVRVISPTITHPDTTYAYQFADNTPAPREYIVLAQYKTPASITLDTSSDLKNSTGAQYLIITYDDFYSNIQPLAAFRQSQGLNVKTVKVQDVYDEFNDGVLDPQAIRDFLKYTYDYWVPKPEMVLLVGDGHYDPRGYCVTPGRCSMGINTTPNTIFIPPALRIVDIAHIETADDNFFVSFNDGVGDLMPQMALGRLPANSPTQVDDMVTKLKNYEQSTPAGDWRGRLSFVSDNYFDENGNYEAGNNFWAYSDAIACSSQYIAPWFTVNRIYYNPFNPLTYPRCVPYSFYTTTDAVHSATLAAINNGSLIVNYVGHGSVNEWAHSFFATTDIATLGNGYKLPMMVEMTCDTGYYIQPTVTWSSLGETNVRKAGGGALASWSATGWGQSSGHDFLDRGFFQSVMWNNVRQIGPATVAGKALLWQSDPTQTDEMKMFVLLGDPASRLQIQFLNNHFFLPFIRRQ
jgi:hypothetical protein